MFERWLFLHVMKTAGTSFRRMLEKSLGQAVYPTTVELDELPNRWYLRPRDLIKAISSGTLDLADRRVVCGHYSGSFRRELSGGWRLATFLRDPVARSLSMIAHRRRYERRFTDGGGRVSDEALVDTYLEDDRFVNAQIRDYQTKVMAMPPLANVSTAMKVDGEVFKRACRAITECDFVGITERFPESLDLFSRLSSICLPDRVLAANRSDPFPVTEAQIERIRRLVTNDLALYAYALERFDSEVSYA